MADDKIIYTKELGKNIVNIVFNHETKMLHIVIATQIKPGEYVGKSVGKSFTVEQEAEAIEIVNKLHERWNEIYSNRKRSIVKENYKDNIKKIAIQASKNLCTN